MFTHRDRNSAAARSEAVGVTCFAISADGSALTSTRSINEAQASRAHDAQKDRLQELMEGYQRADATATTELVQRLSPTLLRFLAGPVQTRSQADDMLQDCWLRVHRARASYRPGSPVLPWIFAIARHTRIDAYRRRSQIERRELSSEDLEATAADASFTPPDGTEGDVWRLVRQLPDSQQEVVRMLKITGMSLEEVAGATGTTVGSVKQKAHRAYRRLRELLTESA
jgi:RNA polymerase sigma-70 factor (ECF subfamily)